MDAGEVTRRDRVLRDYFEGRDWDKGAEALLTRELVLCSAEVLPAYPFVFDHEWEEVPGRTQDGRGDLLFTDGCGAFAVVEVKSILGAGKNNNRRTAVEKQARRYHAAAAARFGSDVKAFVYTDDPMCAGLRSPEDRSLGVLPKDTVVCPGAGRPGLVRRVAQLDLDRGCLFFCVSGLRG